jgi:hypothetical protein
VKTAVPASSDSSRSMLNPRPRGRVTTYAAILGALLSAAAGTACAGGPESPTFNDGVGTVMQNASIAPDAGRATTGANPSDLSAPPSTACTDEGCACAQEGDTVACAGPKIQSGDYTTCAPGKRMCENGAWGACVGKTLYTSSDTLTEDYSTDCGTSSVVWGAVTLQGKTPGGATIDILVQTAASQALLDKATMVHVTELNGSSTTWTSPDVGPALTAAGVIPAAWLRVTLSVTSPDTSTPAQVTEWRQQSSCASR